MERCPGDSDRYNKAIRHETLRVAVCGTVSDCLKNKYPPQLKEVIIEAFMGLYDGYVNDAQSRLHMDGQACFVRNLIQFLSPFFRLDSRLSSLATHTHA
jgi:hypothetical protein